MTEVQEAKGGAEVSNWTDKALRKLDALCAERVMGWKRTDVCGDQVWMDSSGDTPSFREFFEPSFEWEDAGEVVEKMMERGFGYTVTSNGPGHFAAFGEQGKKKGKPVAADCDAATAPLAITLAAVAACSGKTVEEIEKECVA